MTDPVASTEKATGKVSCKHVPFKWGIVNVCYLVKIPGKERQTVSLGSYLWYNVKETSLSMGISDRASSKGKGKGCHKYNEIFKRWFETGS